MNIKKPTPETKQFAAKAGRRAAVRDINRKGEKLTQSGILLKKHFQSCTSHGKFKEYKQIYELAYAEKIHNLLGVAYKGGYSCLDIEDEVSDPDDTLSKETIECITTSNRLSKLIESPENTYTETQQTIIEEVMQLIAKGVARRHASQFSDFNPRIQSHDEMHLQFSRYLQSPQHLAGMNVSLKYSEVEITKYIKHLKTNPPIDSADYYNYGMRLGAVIRYKQKLKSDEGQLSYQDWVDAMINQEKLTGLFTSTYYMYIKQKLVQHRLSLTQLPEEIELELNESQILLTTLNSPKPKGLSHYFDLCKETTPLPHEEEFVAKLLKDGPTIKRNTVR